MKKDTRKYFGIEELDDAKKKAVMSFISMKGELYQGYGPDGYMRNTVKCLDYYMRVRKDDNDLKLEYIAPYFHNSSLDISEITIDNPRVDLDLDDRNYRMVSGYSKRGSCYLAVNLINADNLPSLVEGSVIHAQVIAYPYGKVRLYPHEEVYREETRKNGEIYYRCGTIIPVGYIDRYISTLKDPVEGPDSMLIRGEIHDIKHRKSEIFSEREYYQVVTMTDIGRISLIFTEKQIADGGLAHFRVGSVICGNFWLEGDPAIHRHENYSIQRSDVLALLQNTFECGDAERLRRVMSESIVFKTISSEEEFIGRDAVIDRINYVNENIKSKPFAHVGKILGRRDGKERTGFSKGTDCVVIAYDDPHDHEALAFIKRDEDHLISRLIIESANEYIFEVTSSQRRRWYER